MTLQKQHWVEICDEFYPQYQSKSISSIRYQYFTDGEKILTASQTRLKCGKTITDNGTLTPIVNPITVQIKKQDGCWVGLTLDCTESIRKYKKAIDNCIDFRFRFNGNLTT